MDKQELENRVLNPGFNNKITVNGKTYIRESRALYLIGHLDEPEKVEKEELPSYIIKELEDLLPENEDLILNRFHKEYFERKYGNKYFMSDKALNWFDIPGNTTRLINAIRNGYKPYKEPVWVIKEKEGSGYLVDYKLSDNDVILSSSKANAYPFKDKQQAEAVATLTNNTIEERNE
ncbi:hypothetical protein LQF59_06185 [Tetragenococcus koreensis]|uniref:hypothetical protein n=1 Tax=Tetragenococcus koreensis TaxID=290335 RepID=UPI001F2BD258|nr:hypothetical protein [Tetragenococcus koreensis]MDN6730144.1 hypothetical protein [Alkalibacterium sp.]MDN6751491.1 hypothetical protein [Staphylococcus equorum]MCF1614649.1 hypothetical protein [Tetragenococcus koreensis]MCF1624432.1 hypothetical protein [Tetragenococcus koreensis]MDN6541694.1 hypothetical protein [Tetragenococcus koreensis]